MKFEIETGKARRLFMEIVFKLLNGHVVGNNYLASKRGLFSASIIAEVMKLTKLSETRCRDLIEELILMGALRYTDTTSRLVMIPTGEQLDRKYDEYRTNLRKAREFLQENRPDFIRR